MANELTYASLSDLRATHVLHRELATLLFDPTDIRSALVQVPWSASGSAATKIGQVDVDYAMAAPGEVTQVSNTALVDGSYTLTIAHYTLQFEMSYLAQITAPQGGLDLAGVAQIVANTSGLTMTDIVTALFPSVTASVSETTVDLDVDHVYDAMFTLHAALVEGPYELALYPEQMNNFRQSLRGEGGAIQFVPETADMLRQKAPGLQGTWNGVRIWSMDSITTANAGADSVGCLWGRGAFVYQEGDVNALIPYIPAEARVQAGKVFVQVQQVEDYGKSRVVGHYFPAAAIAENARACKIVTDR